MKRMLMICWLFVLVIGIYISTVGSTYYSPDIPEDNSCPINFNIIWEPYNFYSLPDASDKKGPHEMWYYSFYPKIFASKNLNANWVHARIGCRTSLQAEHTRSDSTHPKFWETGLLAFDSAFTFLQRNDMQILALSSPIGYFRSDCNSSNTFTNDSGYQWFWKVMIGKYANLKDTIHTPWGQVIGSPGQSISEPVLYWGICSEPENAQFLSNGGFYTDTTYNTDPNGSGDTISILYNCGDSSLGHFIHYAKVSCEAINQTNSSVKILGPSTATPLVPTWDTAVEHIFDTTNGWIHYQYTFDDGFEFWEILDDSGLITYFDIISIHGYTWGTTSDFKTIDPDSFFTELLLLRQWLDDNGYSEKEIWLTEIGWSRNWYGGEYSFPTTDPYNIPYKHPALIQRADSIISANYIKFCELALNPETRQWFKKTFLWDLCCFPYPDNRSEEADWTYPAMYRPVTIDDNQPVPGIRTNFYLQNPPYPFYIIERYIDTTVNPHDTTYDTTLSGSIYDPIPFEPCTTLANIYEIIIPKIHLIYPDTLFDTFYLRDTINIEFDDVSDNSSVESLLVKIEMKLNNNDSSWVIIANSLDYNTYYCWITNSWIYNWSIDPEMFSDSCKIRVTVTDPYGLRGISEAEEYFSILKSYWYHLFEPYNLAWQLKWNWMNRDFCNCIYENSDTSSVKYLASITIFDSTLSNPESSGVIGIDNEGIVDSNFIKLFSKDQFLKINSIVEQVNGNGYIFVGQDAPNLFGCIKVVNEDLNILNERLIGSGQTFKVIKVDGDSFLASGYYISGINKKIWMRKFYIRTSDNYPVYCSSWNLLLMPWESIQGDLLSVIYDSDENSFVATGNKKNSGIFIIMVNPSGSLIDSITYPSSYSWAGGIELIKDESDSTYVVVGKEWDDSLGRQAFILKYDYVNDTTIWKRDFSNQTKPWLQSFNSIYIDDDGDYIVAGTANDSIYDYSTSLVVKINHETGYLVPNCVSAPLSVFYTDSIDYSNIGKSIQTSDGGYIIGGVVCNTKVYPWISEAGICKFDADSISEQYHSSSNPFIEFPNYSVLLANSLFRDHSTIRFILPYQSHVKITIYNILGQRVRTLADDERQPGAYELIWDGRDNHGTQVSSGSYFLRFEAGDFRTTKSLTVIR